PVNEPTSAKYHSREMSNWVDSIGLRYGLPPSPCHALTYAPWIARNSSSAGGLSGSIGAMVGYIASTDLALRRAWFRTSPISGNAIALDAAKRAIKSSVSSTFRFKLGRVALYLSIAVSKVNALLPKPCSSALR